MSTKYDILKRRVTEKRDQAEELRRQADEIERQLEGLSATKFGRPCGGCGRQLETELDFAQHFEIPDSRYLNLGYCPVKGDVTKRTRSW